MRENFDDRVREWFPLKIGSLKVILENNEGVDDFDKTKSINTRPSHFGSSFLSSSKRLMNEVNNHVGANYSNSIYYGDTDSMYIQKYWSDLVDTGSVGKFLGLGKSDYGIPGTTFVWFLAPKTKYCLATDEFGVISADRTFKGYSEEHKKIKLNEFISLSEGKIVPGRFLIDWTLTVEGKEIPHSKKGCLDCNNRKIYNEYVIKPTLNCFHCEMQRVCKTCLGRISHKRLYSVDINLLKRKPPNEYHQMLPFYIDEYEPRQNKIDIESATEVLMKKMIKWFWEDVLRGYII